MGYWTAPALWPGETCFIVCGGPSLRGFDFKRLRGRKVIAVNSSIFSAPFADALVFGDGRWWGWHKAAVARMNYAGLIVSPAAELTERWPHQLMRKGKPPGLQLPATALAMEDTSTTPAIGLARHFGVKCMVFLGLDQQAAKDGATHHHPAHHIGSAAGCWDERQMPELKLVAKQLKALGIEAINTSLDSRIDWWPKRAIEDLL